MNSQNSVRKKIRIQGIVNIFIGLLMMLTVITLIFSMPVNIILILFLTVLSIECTIAGLYAIRTSRSPSAFAVNRYSRIQFISWIIWIILGALSAYILTISIILYSGSEGVIIVFVILIFSIYILIGILFYIFCKRAKRFLSENFSEYFSLNTGHTPESAPFVAQVVYPRQPYPEDLRNPQSHSIGPNSNYYAAQSINNSPPNRLQQNELRTFAGQVYDTTLNSSKS